MLVGQGEPTVAVVGHVPTGGLRAQPLADVPLRGTRAIGELGRRERSGAGHRPIEPELVADHHHGAAEHRADVADGLLHELVHLRLVHCRFLSHAPCGDGWWAARRRVAVSTPKLETRSGVRYVNATLIHTTAFACPATTTLSWFIAKNVEPTISAIVVVRFRWCGARATTAASRQVDQVSVGLVHSMASCIRGFDERTEDGVAIPP